MPTRSNFNGEQPRKIDDDRIHFVDPLQNTFQNSDKPSTSLSTPIGAVNSQQAQTPINIPRPNIDLPETPQAPIDDPLNHPLSPPQNDNSDGAPSFALQVPHGNAQQFPVTHDLIPPQIPTDGQSVFIPRPNLDIAETPIDNSNGPLNQGLLPPPNQGSKPVSFDTGAPGFANPNQDGPVIIPEGEVLFAPKPSNGLLPPKDPSPNEINFNGPDQPTSSTPTGNKFGGALGQVVTAVQNKFTGSFGGSSGILSSRQPTTSNQIPVQVIQSSFPSSKPSTQNVFTQTPKDSVQKYQGNFGGSPGVLISDNQYDRVSLTQAQPTAPIPSVVPATTLENKFNGGFGGAQGVLGNNLTPPNQPLATQTLAQLPSVASDTSKSNTIQKYTGQFGGSPGLLQAYDNLKN